MAVEHSSHLIDQFSLLTSGNFITSDKSQSSKEFYFFFFAGSGALGIGGAQLPKILKEYDAIKALGGAVSDGGADLDISPLATLGFPEPLKVADIEKIIRQAPSADAVLAAGEKKSYMASLGYLEQKAFYKLLPDCNPLARYAAFEAIASGSGNLCTPGDYDRCISEWRSPGGLDNFSGALLKASTKRLSAYAFFAFLIGLVIDLIAETGSSAFSS